LRFGGSYQGSSFSELLEVDFAHFRPDLSRVSEADLQTLKVPHGTTVLAFKYADGVVMAGDRLATEGHRVASRDIQKVYSTDSHSMVAIAGAAGPAIEMDECAGSQLERARLELARLVVSGAGEFAVKEVERFLGFATGQRKTRGCVEKMQLVAPPHPRVFARLDLRSNRREDLLRAAEVGEGNPVAGEIDRCVSVQLGRPRYQLQLHRTRCSCVLHRIPCNRQRV